MAKLSDLDNLATLETVNNLIEQVNNLKAAAEHPDHVLVIGNNLWLKAAYITPGTWSQAKSFCENNVNGVAGFDDWRLPTISELRSIIRGCDETETGGACGVTDSCSNISCYDSSGCQGCTTGSGPDSGCYRPDLFTGDCYTLWSNSYRTIETQGNNTICVR